ncbi:MAG: class II fructose-bisphosphate aldolase [Phycisphaerae bacterium]
MLITDRQAVLDVYAEAGQRQWVLPCFCSENLTTTEAVLAAVADHGRQIGQPNLPVTLALTNQYAPRPQSIFYSHTRQWEVGLRLFLADLQVLTAPPSPYAALRVLVHLDHIQYDLDHDLLGWDLRQFSSIMFDASKLPLAENIRRTAAFVQAQGRNIVIEGACDEIVDATGSETGHLTTPEDAGRYVGQTGVDFIVANLGTEHRAQSAELQYHGELARQIAGRIGPKIVLHGCSSVPAEQVRNLYADGVCKVNIWTALERDSAPALFEQMISNAARIVGSRQATELRERGLLGDRGDLSGKPELSHYTTCYRQEIIYQEMIKIVRGYLNLWYR